MFVSFVGKRYITVQRSCIFIGVFFFNDTATTEIYTLSLHDALPISLRDQPHDLIAARLLVGDTLCFRIKRIADERSEEHTSELQSQSNLVCRLLLEKKKIPVLGSQPITLPSSAPDVRDPTRVTVLLS